VSMSCSIAVCCGSGGVGKTTTSAALGLAIARAGHRVAILTIDPAKRLCESLGLEAIGGHPIAVPLPGASGRCDALMLDVQETFEALIRTFSASEEAANRILSNRYFQFASTRLGGVHEYMAAEKVRELAQCGRYDWVVVDTPPSRNALDFLRAPERIAGLMDGGVVKWMAMPATRGGWRALELGSEAVSKVLRLLVGRSTIGEIAEFFDLFRDLWEGFQSRSIELNHLLSSDRTQFFLVTSPSPASRNEALFFLDHLHDLKMPFGGFIINRVERAPSHKTVPSESLSDAIPAPVRQALEEALTRQAELASAHDESIAALLSAGPAGAPHWPVPNLGRTVTSREELLELSAFLPALGQGRN